MMSEEGFVSVQIGIISFPTDIIMEIFKQCEIEDVVMLITLCKANSIYFSKPLFWETIFNLYDFIPRIHSVFDIQPIQLRPPKFRFTYPLHGNMRGWIIISKMLRRADICIKKQFPSVRFKAISLKPQEYIPRELGEDYTLKASTLTRLGHLCPRIMITLEFGDYCVSVTISHMLFLERAWEESGLDYKYVLSVEQSNDLIRRLYLRGSVMEKKFELRNL